MSRLDKLKETLVTVDKGAKGRKVRLADALICSEVYSGSPAEVAGIELGAHLVSINSKPASTFGSLTAYWPALTKYSYKFVSVCGQEILVESPLAEIGIRYNKTTPAISSSYQPERHIYEDLLLLWERQEWELLKKLSAEQMHFFNNTGWLQRKITQPKPCESPASLLYGYALQELSPEAKNGQSFVDDFEENYLYRWTSDIYALSQHYRAKRLLADGQTEQARDLSREAHRLHRYDTTASWHRSQFNEEPPRSYSDESKAAEFPGVFLRPLDGKSPLSLCDFAAGTEPGKWNLFVCLGGYRGNGPYNELMATLRRNCALLAESFSPVLVITEAEGRRADRPHWYVEEDELSKTNLPFRVMFEKGELADLLEIQTSPEAFIVDRDLRVLYRGPLDGHNLWRGLGRASLKQRSLQ